MVDCRRWKDLEITSAKKPFNAHLQWYHATYGWVIVDSTNQAVLLISTDKGDNWSTINLSDNTNSYKIQAGWLDGNDLWFVMCDNDGTADDFEVFFIELDDSNDCNPVGVSAGAIANSVWAWDIFKIGTDMFVISERDTAFHVFEVDTAPFVSQDSESPVDFSGGTIWYGVVIGTKYHTMGEYQNAGAQVNYIHYDDSITTLTIEVGAELAAYSAPDRTQTGVSYDGSDILLFVANKDVGGQDFLIAYSIGGDTFTIDLAYDVALMVDRNNSGTPPTPLEMGFGMTDKITYEIKPRRGGIIILQDLSAQLSGNIVSINDVLLLAEDGGATWDVYE
ncbi:hypothetical protein LCGC14_2972160, partial [marine sediment metagenome]